MMQAAKSTFALFFGNRGFFPSSLMAGAREELPRVLKDLGHDVIMLDKDATPAGAVETTAEGELYAQFLRDNRGKFDGVILSLPNFGDETGAAAALKDAGVPILIQAYPDELDKLSMDHRRDSFCGKFSIMDVFTQYEVPYTTLKPHTVSPSSDAFRGNVEYFDRLCRVTSAMTGLVVGALGARTTPFKTVRYDEVTLQRHGITVETLDLADVFRRIDEQDLDSDACKAKAEFLKDTATWEGVPEEPFKNLVRLGVVMDEIIEEYELKALALRCWTELQQNYGISPCVVTASLMDRAIPAACEVDVANAITMHALGQASGQATSILDWNNNYGEDENKCILFHCGNVAQSLMVEKGWISDHGILKSVLGEGRGYGCSQGRIRPFPFTYGSMMTLDGEVHFYLGEGRFTEDEIPRSFFGCAGVAEIDKLQDVLHEIGQAGHRHHVSLTPGNYKEPMVEAFEKYLGYQVKVY
jgi:L-fucose isomerase-like protein